MQRWPSRRALSGPWIETFSSKRPLPEDDVPGETDGQNSEIPTDRGFSLADVKHLLEYQTKQLLEQTKQTHRQTAEVSSAALNNMISPQGATFLHSTGQNQIRITYDIFLVMYRPLLPNTTPASSSTEDASGSQSQSSLSGLNKIPRAGTRSACFKNEP
ncbi:hypothetical protein FOPG_16004 [Fusarium oxysporum f. sp. conglutinans race 2 54008]|uniref:Uncharacterized protein n=1 Tax=Fusarium oxysporum f. sp. conglutinans race 2 54008 TaxID=1089457 RepID=X0H7I7_FUSOX|nr:hypothetical protein FOPG_16004 [Fusarium oxysporum f. sp. conglutinans race 2 54008]